MWPENPRFGKFHIVRNRQSTSLQALKCLVGHLFSACLPQWVYQGIFSLVQYQSRRGTISQLTKYLNPFGNFEVVPQNPSIDAYYVSGKSQEQGFEALKLWNVRSGTLEEQLIRPPFEMGQTNLFTWLTLPQLWNFKIRRTPELCKIRQCLFPSFLASYGPIDYLFCIFKAIFEFFSQFYIRMLTKNCSKRLYFSPQNSLNIYLQFPLWR